MIKKEQNEKECDTADCPACDEGCERIAECNDDDLDCDCICNDVTDAGSTEPPVLDAGGDEPPTPIVDAGNTESPVVDAGGDIPTVDAGSGTTPDSMRAAAPPQRLMQAVAHHFRSRRR